MYDYEILFFLAVFFGVVLGFYTLGQLMTQTIS